MKYQKEKALNCYSVEFQGKKFKPCRGLMYSIYWGNTIFDIRDFRKSVNMPPEPEYLAMRIGEDNFKERIKQITDFVGDRDFKTLI